MKPETAERDTAEHTAEHVTATAPAGTTAAAHDELLIEEISIDGMCGVY